MITDSLHIRLPHSSGLDPRNTSLVDEYVKIPIVGDRIYTLWVLKPDPEHHTLHGTEHTA